MPCNPYESAILKVIGNFSRNFFLFIVSEDRRDNPIDFLIDFPVDAEPDQPDSRELTVKFSAKKFIACLAGRTGNDYIHIPETNAMPKVALLSMRP